MAVDVHALMQDADDQDGVVDKLEVEDMRSDGQFVVA